MATAISQENFDEALGTAYDSVASDDLTAARKWLALAEIQLAGLAKSASFSGDLTTLRDSLEAARKAVKELAASSSNYRYEIHTIWVPK